MKDQKATCSILKDLSSELDSFRSSNRFSARIPQPLREAILSAIDNGIEPKDVRKILKVGDAQINAWRRGRVDGDKLAIKTTEPRVLNVIPTPPSSGSSPNLRVSYENGRLLLEISL
jgi:hypothetical protein